MQDARHGTGKEPPSDFVYSGLHKTGHVPRAVFWGTSISFAIIIALLVFLFFNKSPNRQNDSLHRATLRVSPAPNFNSSTATDTANWKTYTNIQAGFSFKYPEYIRLSTDQSYKSNEVYSINVTVQTIDSLVSAYKPLGTTSEAEIQSGQIIERKNLEQEASIISQGLLPEFKKFQYGIPQEELGDVFIKVEKIGTTYAVDYINIYGYDDACNVHFDRGILLYKNNYRITVSISLVQNSLIVKSMPIYFQSYNNKWCWKNENGFEKAVISGNGSQEVKEWLDELTKIISTFRFD